MESLCSLKDFMVILTVILTLIKEDNTSYISEHHRECVMMRTLRNNGFHREIYTTLNITAINTLDSGGGDLAVLVNEHLPSGLYIDLYQTKAAEQFGGLEVYSEEDIDLENPEFSSPGHEIYWFGHLHRDTFSFYTEAVLPIHLRYHKPNSEGLADIELIIPDVWVRKQDGGSPRDSDKVFPCNITKQSLCNWSLLTCPVKNSPRNGLLHMTVSAGKIEHKVLVISLTLLVSISAMAFLVYSVVIKDKTSKNKVK